MASSHYQVSSKLQTSLQQQTKVSVVMVPFPAQGHLNQLLQLSRLISSYGIAIHYVGTPSGNYQAKLRVHGWNPTSIANIHFHDFPIPSFPTPDPDSSAKFPSHLQPSFEASSSHLRRPVASLLRELSGNNRRVVVIHDSLMGSVVQDIVSLPNAESYTFHSVSAFAIFHFLWEQNGKPFRVDAKILQDLPSLDGCFTPEFSKFISTQYDYLKLSSGRIYNTSIAVERTFLDLLAKKEISKGKKQFALGPFNPVAIRENRVSNQRHKCLEWLDKQASNSVIHVSFGTTVSLSNEQIIELAIGLEKSKQRFIWVLSDADKGNVFDPNIRKFQLPNGFQERLRGKGLIVKDWAPQLEILAHPAVGGFMSHCGWNSSIESITFGVPTAAWPMHSDQPRNAVLVTKHLKVGLVVKDWAHRDELVKSSTIEHVVKMLMASKEGEQIRKRAADLGAAVRKSVEDGGVARMEWASFIAHITR